MFRIAPLPFGKKSEALFLAPKAKKVKDERMRSFWKVLLITDIFYTC